MTLSTTSGSVERTYYIPHCDACPTLMEMSMRNLVRGQCPRCGKTIEGRKAIREIARRRLLEGVDSADHKSAPRRANDRGHGSQEQES